jgi:hypothetical protein
MIISGCHMNRNIAKNSRYVYYLAGLPRAAMFPGGALYFWELTPWLWQRKQEESWLVSTRKEEIFYYDNFPQIFFFSFLLQPASEIHETLLSCCPSVNAKKITSNLHQPYKLSYTERSLSKISKKLCLLLLCSSQ